MCRIDFETRNSDSALRRRPRKTLKECANPRDDGTDRDINNKMQYMRLFVIAEHMRSDNAFQFGIKMREKV